MNLCVCEIVLEPSSPKISESNPKREAVASSARAEAAGLMLGVYKVFDVKKLTNSKQ